MTLLASQAILAQSNSEDPYAALAPVAMGAFVVGFLLVAAAIIVVATNVGCAASVMMREERVRLGIHKAWWVLLSLVVGPFAAVPYIRAQRGRERGCRCPYCGYESIDAEPESACPECRTAMEIVRR